jgi:hypothetical protein
MVYSSSIVAQASPRQVHGEVILSLYLSRYSINFAMQPKWQPCPNRERQSLSTLSGELERHGTYEWFGLAEYH